MPRCSSCPASARPQEQMELFPICYKHLTTLEVESLEHKSCRVCCNACHTLSHSVWDCFRSTLSSRSQIFHTGQPSPRACDYAGQADVKEQQSKEYAPWLWRLAMPNYKTTTPKWYTTKRKMCFAWEKVCQSQQEIQALLSTRNFLPCPPLACSTHCIQASPQTKMPWRKMARDCKPQGKPQEFEVVLTRSLDVIVMRFKRSKWITSTWHRRARPERCMWRSMVVHGDPCWTTCLQFWDVVRGFVVVTHCASHENWQEHWKTTQPWETANVSSVE